MIVALVLAAGESARMGRPKPLLPLGRGTLIAAAVRPFVRAPEVDRVIVVVGCRAAEVALAVPPHEKVAFAYNRNWRLGMASSIRCGMRAAGPRVHAVLLALGDQPRVPPAAIVRVVAAWRAARPRPLAVVPVHGGRRGHPALFDGRLASALGRLRGDQGARGLLRRRAAQVLEVPVRSRGILEDVDTPADYAALRRRRR